MFAPMTDDQMAPGMLPAPQMPTGMFGRPMVPKPSLGQRMGGARNIAGIASDFFAGLAGQQGTYGPMMAKRRLDEAERDADLRKAMVIAAYKRANPDPTSLQQNAQAAGLVPGTPQYQDFVKRATLAPHYLTLGSPDTGQTVIDANQIGGMSGGAPTAPAIGTVEDGHRFLGGDPSSPTSWAKVS